MAPALVEMFEDIAGGHDMGSAPASPSHRTTTLEHWARVSLASVAHRIKSA